MLSDAPCHGADPTATATPAPEPPQSETFIPFPSNTVPTPPEHLTQALTAALRSQPGPITALTLVIPAASCRFATRSFPADLAAPEAHALAAQMAAELAAELGHTAPIAFDWQRLATHEIALCLAPRVLISGYMEAVQAAGLRCLAISPDTAAASTGPELAPFNLIPWRNASWLQQGQRRVLWLAAASLFAITSAALLASGQAQREQALNAQQTTLEAAIKARQAQLPDLAKLRQQLVARQAAQHADRAARAASQRQQAVSAKRLEQLARTRPRKIRYLSLSYDAQEIRLEGLAQTPLALTHLLKTLPCPHLKESHRDAHGLLRFALQLPTTCAQTPATTAP